MATEVRQRAINKRGNQVSDRIEVTIEAVTATFLHVEPNGQACWRAAPFRGLARWWFRAIGGAAWTLDEVRRREAEAFGEAESASPVMFRIVDGGGNPGRFDINPGSPRSAQRSALPPGSVVRLRLQANPWARNPAAALRKAYSALWVSLQLGGVGQRCRRGAGSLRICSVELPSGWDDLPRQIGAEEPKALASELTRGLRIARREIGAIPVVACGVEAPYPILHAEHADVRVLELDVPASPGQQPAEAARRELMNVRRRPAWHQSNREREFGSIEPRLASPLWLRIAGVHRRDHGHTALVVATLLRHAGASGAQWGRVMKMLDEGFKKQPEPTLVDLKV
jgi:CRISPR type III-B/RAMP module RAMP protein Cmr1